MNVNTMPLEADTRVLIDRTLENLGWKLKGKDKNVFYEQPRTEAEKKKLGGKRPDYVLYSKDTDKPLIIIEAKKKGSRIDDALQQGIEYARAIDAPLVFATDGVFCKAFHTYANRPPILNGEEVDDLSAYVKKQIETYYKPIATDFSASYWYQLNVMEDLLAELKSGSKLTFANATAKEHAIKTAEFYVETYYGNLTYISEGYDYAMDLMQIKMLKEVRNNINRTTNFETANLSKITKSSSEHIILIQKILKSIMN